MIFGKYVNKYYKKYFLYIFLGLLCLIFVDVIQIFISPLIGNVVNIFSDNTKSTGELFKEFYSRSLFDPNGFWFFTVSLALIAVGMFLGRMGWRLALFRLGVNVEFDMRQDMFLHAENLSVAYYKDQKVGSLMSLFNNDLNSIKNCFIDGVIMSIDGFVMAPLVIIAMFINNWQLTLFSIIPLSLLMVACLIVDKGMTTRYEAQLGTFDKLSDYTQESFGGVSVIKAFVKEAKFMCDFAKKNQNNREANKSFLRYSVFLNIIIELLINSVFVIIIFVGVNVVIGNPDYKAGNLVTFIGYLGSAIWPFMAIAQVILIGSRGKASLKIITKFMDTQSELKDVKENTKGATISGDIIFKDFNFSYPDSPTSILEHVNLHIKQGQNVGIVGPTGSGKSTLVKVLLKIYNIDDGKLFFDNIDINDIPSSVIRDKIGYVSQNTFLFSDLIKNNIAFKDDQMSDKNVEDVAKFACIDDSIRSFKEGYKTIIGEKGTSLSGGQKQRVSIARAQAKNPNILILDDSVSAVDSETEKQILANIKRVRKDMTTIIISSRVSVVENLDCIIVMSEGKIVGVGDHNSLVKNCPQYKQTVDLQQLESGFNDGRIS